MDDDAFDDPQIPDNNRKSQQTRKSFHPAIGEMWLSPPKNLLNTPQKLVTLLKQCSKKLVDVITFFRTGNMFIPVMADVIK